MRDTSYRCSNLFQLRVKVYRVKVQACNHLAQVLFTLHDNSLKHMASPESKLRPKPSQPLPLSNNGMSIVSAHETQVKRTKRAFL